MALTTRYKIGLAALVPLVALVAVLPPRSCGRAERGTTESGWKYVLCGGVASYRDGRHTRSVDLARRRIGEAVQGRRTADSLAAALRRGPVVWSADSMVAVMYEFPLSADSARTWLRLVLAELSRLPAAQPSDGRIVVALATDPARNVDNKMGARQNLPNERLIRRQLSPGPDGGATCWVSVAAWRSRYAFREMSAGSGDQATATFIGWCGLVGRYGRPGHNVYEWARAAYDEYDWITRSSVALEMLESTRRRSGERWTDFRSRACLSGDGDQCLSAIGLTTDLESRYSHRAASRAFSGWLLAHRPASEFQAMWRSPRMVSDALREAYGSEASGIAYAWARSYLAESVQEPRFTLKTVVAGIGWTVLAMLAGMAVGHLRRGQ